MTSDLSQTASDLRFLGIDLAWGEGTAVRAANESGVVALDPDGTIVDAGWAVGLDAVVEWVERWATANTVLFVDAPLVVLNETGMRECEKDVARRFGRWKVGANASNRGSLRSAGVALRERLAARGWRYADGTDGPVTLGRTLRGSLDFAVAEAFIASIPAGRWSSYGDVAAAAGAPKGAQALGTWLLKSEHDIRPARWPASRSVSVSAPT